MNIDRDDLVGSLVLDLKPVRRLRRVHVRALTWASLAVSFVGVGVIVLGARADLAAKLRDPWFLAEALLLLLVFMASGRRAFQLSVPGSECRTFQRMLPFVGLVTWLLLLVVELATEPSVPAASLSFACAARMLGLAFVPGVALMAMLGRAAPLEREWTGVLAALAACSLAILGTRAVCARDDPMHVLLWHFVPVAIVALAGIGVGRAALRRPIAAGR